MEQSRVKWVSAAMYTLRPAVQADSHTIRAIIRAAQINPLGLDWHRFILAVDANDKIIGTGQIKPHGDGTRELASIAVLPAWRGKGVARAIIEHLLAENPGTLYLTCRAALEPLYQKFGFHPLSEAELPPYFRRVLRFFNKLIQHGILPEGPLVMKRG